MHDRPDLDTTAAEMERLYASNLELFRQVAPNEFQRFVQWQTRRYEVRWFEEVGVTIVDTIGDRPIYPGDPHAHALRQVERFRAAPSRHTCRFLTKEVLQGDTTLHVRSVNEATQRLNAGMTSTSPELPNDVSTLFVLGVGLGHHLLPLLESAEVRNLCIVEPEMDLFLPSLHTVDWLPILEYFSRPGYSLEVVVGRSPHDAILQIRDWLDEIGGFHIVERYVFEHLSSPEMKETWEGIANVLVPLFTSQLGYYDDERVGMAHTLANVEAGIPVFEAPLDADDGGALPPAFVVANGPSLDEAIDWLTAHRDRGIVLSCGSALGSLIKAGITPDIHVEMERTRPVYEWVSHGSTEEERARIHLLGLNTVHPDVFDLFPNRGMMAKPNDLGAHWMDSRLPGDRQLPNAVECNPTVGNCGLAVAARLGFRDVHLFGMDLGYPAGTQHHSRLSTHYEVSEDQQSDLGVYAWDDPNNPLAEGNFGEQVRTTPVYVNAARAVGRLAMYHPGITIRNTANGLKMPGTVPTRVSDLPIGEALDTRAFVQQLFADGFDDRRITAPSTRERVRIAEGVRVLAERLSTIVGGEVATRADALSRLSRAHELLRESAAHPKRSFATAILRGSFAHFALLLAQAVHADADERIALGLFRSCREPFLAFLQDVESVRSVEDFYRLDDRSRDLEKRIARSA